MEKQPTRMAPQIVVSLPSEPRRSHHDQMVSPSESPRTITGFSKTRRSDEEEAATRGPPKCPVAASLTTATAPTTEEDTGRARLKRHRSEVAGRVWIPEMWGQEELLKDWIDCTAFDASLVSSNIMLARAALVQEGRRANSSGVRIENRC